MVDFEGKTIPDFDRFYSFLSFEEIEYSAIEVDGVDAKNIHSYICAAYFFDLANEIYEDRLNFTIFERKPPIYKRELFKYLSIISLTIFLSASNSLWTCSFFVLFHLKQIHLWQLF